MQHGHHVIMACRRMGPVSSNPRCFLLWLDSACRPCPVLMIIHARFSPMPLCRCEEARADLISRSLTGSCECSRLDLGDFASVRAFASATRQSLQSQNKQLTLLINNAGGFPSLG